jgi:hypothetical protein
MDDVILDSDLRRGFSYEDGDEEDDEDADDLEYYDDDDDDIADDDDGEDGFGSDSGDEDLI